MTTPSRLALGSAGVFSVSEAAKLLPWRDSHARQWLRDHGLVRAVPGRAPVVIWSDVLDELRRATEEPAAPRAIGTLPRAGLRR